MKHRYITKYTTICLALVLAGCTLNNTPYERPKLQMPASWSHKETTPYLPAAATDHWWQQFGDKELDRLITEVLARNNDLAVATLKLHKARLEAKLADSDRLPSLSVDGSGQISHSYGSTHRETRSFSATGSVSYELDLWNRVKRTADAANWEASATEQDLESTAISLVATTAGLYWQIGYLNQRISLSQASIAYAQKTLQLAQVKKQAGAATGLDILEAERSLATQQASHTQLVQQQKEAQNALAVLFDGPPSSLKSHELTGLAQVPQPRVDAGLPAQLLARRPDLRAAEMRLRETLAESDATSASYYPTIGLTGSYGGSSDQLSRLLSSPVATLGADLTLPFVQWRDMQRNIKIARIAYKEAIINFRQTLYSALADVENGLSARTQYERQAEKLRIALDTSRRTEALYQVKYRAGAISMQTWLDAQEDRRQAEINLVENKYNRLQNYLTLVKALGGDTTIAPAAKGIPASTKQKQ